jgi:hypothetical protein
VGLVAVAVTLLGLAAALGPGLVGYRTIVVETANLLPLVPQGAVMVQEPVLPGQLRPADVISFTSDIRPGIVFTHLVLGVRPQASVVEVRSQPPGGDEEEVWLVHPGQPVGRLVYWVPLAGYLVGVLSSPAAWLVAIVLGSILLWLSLRAARGAALPGEGT